MTTASGSVALGENLRTLSKSSNSSQGETPGFPNSPDGSKSPLQSPNGFPPDPANLPRLVLNGKEMENRAPIKAAGTIW
jgi:hypothetical protein